MATTPAAVGPPACLACAVTRATWIIPRGHRPVRESNSIKKAGAISAPKWSREFEDPIVLADGRKILTLRDAATYITKLPKPEQDLEIWQIAVEHLIRAAETGGAWLMLARIGVLKALHRGRVREFNSDRKDTHWGKRKLKRLGKQAVTPPSVTTGCCHHLEGGHVGAAGLPGQYFALVAIQSFASASVSKSPI